MAYSRIRFEIQNSATMTLVQTYVETQEGVCYLSLITDLYSRKIVGWALGDTLQASHCLRALNMALTGLSEPLLAHGLIYHSDRGLSVLLL